MQLNQRLKCCIMFIKKLSKIAAPTSYFEIECCCAVKNYLQHCKAIIRETSKASPSVDFINIVNYINLVATNNTTSLFHI